MVAGKQDTSSDTSREVPERTHKDTTKEARLHEGSVLPLRLCKSWILRSFSRRFPCPRFAVGGGRGATALPLRAREICFAAAIWIPPFRFGVFSIPKNKACGRKLSRSESLRRRPPGLSQPDAPYEHTDIRAKAENLTTPNRKNRRRFPLDVAPPTTHHFGRVGVPPPTASYGRRWNAVPT